MNVLPASKRKSVSNGCKIPPRYRPRYPFRSFREVLLHYSIVLKKRETEGYRLVWNESRTLQNSLSGILKSMSGIWVPLADNNHVKLPTGADFELAYIEANNQIMEIMADGEMEARLTLFERVYDLK